MISMGCAFLSFAVSHRIFPEDPEDTDTVTDKSRKLGLVVIRGTQVSIVSPEEGMEEIANPFIQQGEEE